MENKFQNLAIVVCHIFLGGNFRQIYLIHELKILDCRLMQDINFQCPKVTWIISDLHRPKPHAQYVDRNGYDTLQLIVIKQDQYFDEITLVQSFVAYYSIFIFDTNVQEQTETLINARNSLAMIHDTTSGIVQLSSLIGRRGSTAPIQLNITEMNALAPVAVFEMTFGERERIRELGIFLTESFCYDRKYRKTDGNYYHNFFLANFFVGQLNMSLFKTLRHQCDPSGNELFFTYQRIPQPIYGEISFDSTFVKVK